MTPGTSCGSMAKLAGDPYDARMRPTGSPASSLSIVTSILAPARRMISSIAVRVGFRPTPSISISAPGVPAARATQNVALETSPGTTRSRALRRWPPVTLIASPVFCTRTPNS